MLGDPRKTRLGLQMHAQWHLFGGRRQMHRAYAPFARWVILLRVTLLATVVVLAAAILVDVRLTHPRAHRVAPAAALVALHAAPIPIGLTRIKRPLPNASSTGVIVACRRTPVSMPLCLSATT